MITVKNASISLSVIAIAGILIAAASAISISSEERLGLCFNFSCISNIPFFFKAPLEILSNTMELVASVAVTLGVIISVRTFTESEAAKTKNQKQEHYSNFLETVRKSTIKNHLPPKRNINSYIYSACFAPDSNPPCLSSTFHEVVQQLANLIDESNTSLQKHPGGFSISTHGEKLYAAISKLGIDITAKRNADIPPHEQAIFEFLDRLSEKEPEKATYLLEIERNYHFK